MIGVVRFKAGVVITGPPSPAQARIIAACDAVARATGRDIVITCGEEEHKPDDPHTERKAFDVRVVELDPPDIIERYKRLATDLGSRWTVIYEDPNPPSDPVLRGIWYGPSGATAAHIHIQPVRGSEYPPVPVQP